MNRLAYNEEKHRKNSNYFWLLVFFMSLLFFPIFSIFFKEYSELILRISASVIILWGSYVVTYTKKELITAWFLAVLAVFGFWCEHTVFQPSEGVSIFRIFTGIIYFGYLGRRIILQLLEKNHRVNLNLLYGAVIVYFIIGIIGGQLCNLLDILEPGTFFRNAETNSYNYYYFSFVTLTAVGYGDFTPSNEAGRAMALLIGLFGQIYLAIAMAIIIGNYLNQGKDNPG
ncbi:MAG: potassium channel family protein [Bacteroidota bacterium]